MEVEDSDDIAAHQWRKAGGDTQPSRGWAKKWDPITNASVTVRQNLTYRYSTHIDINKHV